MNNAITDYTNTAAEIEAWGCKVVAVFAAPTRGAGVDQTFAAVTCDRVAMGVFHFVWDARSLRPVVMCSEFPAGAPGEVMASLCAHVAAHVHAENEAQTIRRRA